MAGHGVGSLNVEVEKNCIGVRLEMASQAFRQAGEG